MDIADLTTKFYTFMKSAIDECRTAGVKPGASLTHKSERNIFSCARFDATDDDDTLRRLARNSVRSIHRVGGNLDKMDIIGFKLHQGQILLTLVAPGTAAPPPHASEADDGDRQRATADFGGNRDQPGFSR